MVADKVFYTIYRFFEEMHGPGDSAEVAALFTWGCLLALNFATALVLLIAVAGTPAFLNGRIGYVFAAIGLIVAISQYFRYLCGDRLRQLANELKTEPLRNRRRRRWSSVVFSVATPGAFCLSLWLLSVLRG